MSFKQTPVGNDENQKCFYDNIKSQIKKVQKAAKVLGIHEPISFKHGNKILKKKEHLSTLFEKEKESFFKSTLWALIDAYFEDLEQLIKDWREAGAKLNAYQSGTLLFLSFKSIRCTRFLTIVTFHFDLTGSIQV